MTYLVTYTHVTYTLFGFMLKPLEGQQCLAETDLWVSGIKTFVSLQSEDTPAASGSCMQKPDFSVLTDTQHHHNETMPVGMKRSRDLSMVATEHYTRYVVHHNAYRKQSTAEDRNV